MAGYQDGPTLPAPCAFFPLDYIICSRPRTDLEDSEMKIVVTGSSGRIGWCVYHNLVNSGHDVLGVDVLPARPDVKRSLRVDLTKSGEIYGALGQFKAEAVIHMGAWANPGHVPDQDTYRDNVTGTFNLFQACADLGIMRVVSASSGQVYGLAGHSPEYVRMGESHALHPLSCYAESKIAGESAARYFSEKYGLSIASFRFMGVRLPSQISADIESIVQDPASGRWLMWTRTDARDAAEACRLAVEVEELETGPYNITGARTVLNTDTEELVRAHFGDSVTIHEDLVGTLSPLTCARAKQAFGYEPRYVWTETDRHEEV
jgi:nucleoside-diphosphate-sugar epimerase